MIFIILLIYVLLGCVFESMSMILLTVPIFAPLVHQLGFDLIWFGILVVVVTEISLITPPIGLNVFVLKGVVRDVSVSTIFKGVTPFWCADIIRLILLTSIPAILAASKVATLAFSANSAGTVITAFFTSDVYDFSLDNIKDEI